MQQARQASKRSSNSPIDSCLLLKPRSVTVKRCPSQRGISPSTSPASNKTRSFSEVCPVALSVRLLQVLVAKSAKSQTFCKKRRSMPAKQIIFKANRLWILMPSCYIHRTECQPFSGDSAQAFISVSVVDICSAIFTVAHVRNSLKHLIQAKTSHMLYCMLNI